MQQTAERRVKTIPSRRKSAKVEAKTRCAFVPIEITPNNWAPVTESVRMALRGEPRALELYLALAMHCDHHLSTADGMTTWWSTWPKLAEEVGASVSSVRRAAEVLRERGVAEWSVKMHAGEAVGVTFRIVGQQPKSISGAKTPKATATKTAATPDGIPPMPTIEEALAAGYIDETSDPRRFGRPLGGEDPDRYANETPDARTERLQFAVQSWHRRQYADAYRTAEAKAAKRKLREQRSIERARKMAGQ